MFCEYCDSKHDGSYGSGRFCKPECARAFSTAERRGEINSKVAKKLKGRGGFGKPFFKGYDPRRDHWTPEKRLRAGRKAARSRTEKISSLPWESCSVSEKRRRVIKEQDGRCSGYPNGCGLSHWQGMKLTLELHHIDGDNRNNSRENLVALCSNCHSLTPDYRSKSLVWKNGEMTESGNVPVC